MYVSLFPALAAPARPPPKDRRNTGRTKINVLIPFSVPVLIPFSVLFPIVLAANDTLTQAIVLHRGPVDATLGEQEIANPFAGLEEVISQGGEGEVEKPAGDKPWDVWLVDKHREPRKIVSFSGEYVLKHAPPSPPDLAALFVGQAAFVSDGQSIWRVSLDDRDEAVETTRIRR